MNLVFSAGTARGGTNIRTYSLNAHSQVQLSIDAFLPLFKYFRYRILNKSSSINHEPIDWNIPLPDLFNNSIALANLQQFWSEAEDIEIPNSHWEWLFPSIQTRTKLASQNLLPNLNRIQGKTFMETISNILQLIQDLNKSELQIAGIQENWISEFFPALARIYPKAKFLLYIRDPRAVVNSSENHEPDASKHPSIFSLIQHIRKHLSLTIHLKNSPELKNRVIVTKYEDFILNKKPYNLQICKFLGIESQEKMTDYSELVNGSDHKIMHNLANYEAGVDNWRIEGRSEFIEFTNFALNPEMKFFDYPVNQKDLKLTDEIVTFLSENMKNASGWKEHSKDLDSKINWEKERFEYLNKSPNKIPFSTLYFWSFIHYSALRNRGVI